MDWNNIKIFLALVRAGNVRSAAESLGISHSTVARKAESLEIRVGAKLFHRKAGGYQLTPAGEDMFEVAENIEKNIQDIDLRITGRDRQLSGVIQLSMVDILASHLMMPIVASFSEKYPNVDLDINTNYRALDLNKREADIALRFTSSPPEHLIARPLGNVAASVYAHKDYLKNHNLEDPKSACWIGYSKFAQSPKWLKKSPYPHLLAKGNFESMATQLGAVKAKMGIGLLPCFMCDAEPDLIKIHPEVIRSLHFNLWLLRHPMTRFTARLQALSDYIVQSLQELKPLIEGNPDKR